MSDDGIVPEDLMEILEPDQVGEIARPSELISHEERKARILTNAIAWCFYGDDSKEVMDVDQDDIDRCRAVAERCLADLREDSLRAQAESNLVQHSRRELELLGEEPATIDWYCDTVYAFASYGHSGGSSSVAIPILYKLLQCQNLNELTDDPEEWVQQDHNLWQNKRCGEAFSEDGGKTYYLLSELNGSRDRKRRKWHKTVSKDHKELELPDGRST